MKWSWRLGSVAGIDIFLHWTFLLLVGWIFFSYVAQGQGWEGAVGGVLFLLAIFGCVFLHELGHALAARRFGIATRDITILPIGGLARLQRMPEQPWHEFVVAIAGPLVNLVIAAALSAGLLVTPGRASLMPGVLSSGTFLQNLLWSNVALAVFNLVPAFPMDGGRILRSALASFLDYSRATQIAASIGQGVAILFAIAGLFVFSNPMLVFIAMFIFLGASSEARLVEAKSLLQGVPVRDAMMTRFRTLRPDDSLSVAAIELLAGMQKDFPVVHDDRFLGMLRRADLAAGLQETGKQLRVADVMVSDCPAVSERDMLESVMSQMEQAECSVLPVLSGQQLMGLIDTDNVGELMMIRSALQRRGDRQTSWPAPG